MSWMVNICRRSFRKTPMYSEAMQKAKVMAPAIDIYGKERMMVHRRCASCGRLFREAHVEKFTDENGKEHKKKVKAMVAVDHIDPVIPLTGWVDFNSLVERMFTDNLQVLCNYKGVIDDVPSCHAVKTKQENKQRREYAKIKKEKK